MDFGELCLTEEPLALLHSERLTAVFFYLRLPHCSLLGTRAQALHKCARCPIRTALVRISPQYVYIFRSCTLKGTFTRTRLGTVVFHNDPVTMSAWAESMR